LVAYGGPILTAAAPKTPGGRAAASVPSTTEGSPPAQRVRAELTAGLAFIAIGLLLQLCGTTAALRCAGEREAPPACTVEWRILFDLVPVWRTSFAELRGAQLLSAKGSQSGSRRTYQAILATELGDRRLNLLGSRAPIEAFVAEIEHSLEYRYHDFVLKLRPSGPGKGLRWVGTGLALFGLSYFVRLPLELYRRTQPVHVP
jgi:hypothetical protein